MGHTPLQSLESQFGGREGPRARAQPARARARARNPHPPATHPPPQLFSQLRFAGSLRKHRCAIPNSMRESLRARPDAGRLWHDGG